jgi:nucleotide-binding universal stress UspA family protein
MRTIKTILHPTDFSRHSDYAFRLACSLARDHGARVVALHVVTPPAVVYGEGVLASWPQGSEAQAQNQLSLLQPPQGVQMERRLGHGDAATEILRVAGETGCELIVMGTHGWTGLGTLPMGSVAVQVVRRAPCPVLTVKTPLGQRPTEEPVPAAAGQGADTPW